MRPLLLSLLAASAAFAQMGPSRSLTLGAASFGPTFTGKLEGVQDGQPILVDLDADLGLAKDKAKVGLLLDYQGPRFGFLIQSGGTDYAGDKTLTRLITIDGKPYLIGTRVQSHLHLKTVEGIWTIRFVPLSTFWVGLDLGAESWKLDVDATDVSSPSHTSAATSVSAPIPQLGLSLGSHAPGGLVEVKGFYRYLGAKGAKYSRAGVDLRVFPIPHVGLRAFYEAETFDVPKGSLQDDLMLNLDRKGAGFGLVVRF